MSFAKASFTMLLALAAAGPAFALTAQQERMKTCNTDASTQKLSGDARKTFLSGCLKTEAAAPAPKPLTAQQQKMKSCNTDASAKSLKGPERRTFMSTCLKG